jgi:hypothetical protein
MENQAALLKLTHRISRKCSIILVVLYLTVFNFSKLEDIIEIVKRLFMNPSGGLPKDALTLIKDYYPYGTEFGHSFHSLLYHITFIIIL